jgi:hypothetical protein
VLGPSFTNTFDHFVLILKVRFGIAFGTKNPECEMRQGKGSSCSEIPCSGAYRDNAEEVHFLRDFIRFKGNEKIPIHGLRNWTIVSIRRTRCDDLLTYPISMELTHVSQNDRRDEDID